jgi:hypothetical protein
VNFLHRRRARFLIKRAQPFADKVLVAVANFTWLGNSMGSRPGVLGRSDLAGGLPQWTLIGAGASRLWAVGHPVPEWSHLNRKRVRRSTETLIPASEPHRWANFG